MRSVDVPNIFTEFGSFTVGEEELFMKYYQETTE
jgi:hypothetical protein